MSKDFKIDSERFQMSDEIVEKLREGQRRASERVAEAHYAELDRQFVRAVHDGHDYLDVHVDPGMEIEFIAWDEGEEPDYGPFSEPLERYDLRGVTYADIRRAHEEGHRDG